MLNMIRSFAAVLIVITIGYALLLLIFRANPIRSRLLAFSFSLGLGFGFLAMSCLIHLAIAKRISFSVVYISLPLSILVILWSKGMFRPFRLLTQPRREKVDSKVENPKRTIMEKAILGCGILLVGILIFIVSFNLLARPIFHFDSCVIWAHKAKILAYEHTIF